MKAGLAPGVCLHGAVILIMSPYKAGLHRTDSSTSCQIVLIAAKLPNPDSEQRSQRCNDNARAGAPSLPAHSQWAAPETSSRPGTQENAAYKYHQLSLMSEMSRYVLALSVGLAGLCLASSADLSNGFNSKLSWQSPAMLQVDGPFTNLQSQAPSDCSHNIAADTSPPTFRRTSCTIYAYLEHGMSYVYGVEQGMDLSRNSKPIMYMFNQPWCGACKKLKETFQQEGDKISKLSEKFILVNVGGDDNNAFGVRVMPVLQYYPVILACFVHQAMDLLQGHMS